MYDELVKRLWECAFGECFNCSRYTETTNPSVCAKELMKQTADAIKELSKPRWISVSEKLPENGKYLVATHFLGMENEPLLVSVADYAQSLESVDKYDFEGDNRPGWYCYDSEYGFYERKGIRFYMPLPQPPKEE